MELAHGAKSIAQNVFALRLALCAERYKRQIYS